MAPLDRQTCDLVSHTSAYDMPRHAQLQARLLSCRQEALGLRGVRERVRVIGLSKVTPCLKPPWLPSAWGVACLATRTQPSPKHWARCACIVHSVALFPFSTHTASSNLNLKALKPSLRLLPAPNSMLFDQLEPTGCPCRGLIFFFHCPPVQ